MLFYFFRRLFGLADEGSRKRRADETEGDCATSGAKKHCCDREGAHAGRMIYADENDEEEIEYPGGSSANRSPSWSSQRASNGTSCTRRRFASYHREPTVSGNCRKSIQMNGRDRGSSGLAARCSATGSSGAEAKYSTLARTNQLREKQEYGQLLQRFLPQKSEPPVCVKTKDHEPKRRPVAEVIDLEKYETPVKDKASRETSRQSRPLFSTPTPSTPTTSTPLRWYTPRENRNHETPVRGKAKDEDVSILAIRRSSNSKNDEIAILKVRSTPREKSERSTSVAKVATPTVVDLAQDSIGSSSSKAATPMKLETTKNQSRNCLEVIRTNTLRDNLSAKAVIKSDFVPRVSEHYNERLEQRMKEAEELERVTSLLSKHNRVARETALEEQLARSMRLYEAVLDETEEPEEAPLPELTPHMHQVIRQALVPNPPNEVLVEAFGLRITRKDIHTLSGLNWLNDEVINFYMNLLIVRGTNNDKCPKVHAMNTFFYPKLLSAGHSSLKRWTRKIDIFAQDILVVPIHLGIHWCMSIIDFRDKSIRYYDSMGGSNPTCLATLRQYLEDECMDKRKKPYDTSEWTLESMKKIPQQMNGSDCGVFSCMFAEFITANRKISFSQHDMPYFRNKMVYEILEAKLL